jgi:potassium/hydrogen antiporter
MELAIIGLSLLFFGGHALQWIFEKTKVPDLLILIILGHIIGPVTGLVSQDSLGQVGQLVATLALIVILYEAGLQLSTKDLKEAWGASLIMSLMAFVSIAIIVILITTPVVGFPFSMLIAFAAGSTSSAVVIPMVKFLSIEQRTKTILSLESAFTDIFAIVLFLVTIEGIQAGKMDAFSIFFNIGPKTLISVGFGLLGAFSWAIARQKAKFLTQMNFSGEAWALFCYGMAELLTLNGALAVLSLGFALANLNLLPNWMTDHFSRTPVTRRDMTILSQITLILKTFFFLYLGMLASFSNLSFVSIAMLISLAIFTTRWVSVKILFPTKKGQRLLDVLTVTAMGPRGLACAVLATIPLRMEMPSGYEIQQILFATIPITILFTAIFVFLSESPSFRKKLKFLFPRHPNGMNQTTEAETESV